MTGFAGTLEPATMDVLGQRGRHSLRPPDPQAGQAGQHGVRVLKAEVRVLAAVPSDLETALRRRNRL